MISRTYHLAAEIHRSSAAEMWRYRHKEPLLPRIGKVAIAECLHLLAFRRFINQFEGYHYLDSGSQSVVMASDGEDHVMKVLIHSGTFSEKRAKEMSVAYQSTADTAQKYLGDQWLETTFHPTAMDTMPFALPGYGVVAIQEKVAPAIEAESLENLIADNIDLLAPEMTRMINAVRLLYRDHGGYPDIRGNNNVIPIRQEGHIILKVIDTNMIPGNTNMYRKIPGTNKTVADDITEKIDFLEQLISENTTKHYEFREAALR